MCTRRYHAVFRCLSSSWPSISNDTRYAFVKRHYGHQCLNRKHLVRSGSIFHAYQRGFSTEALPPFLVPPTIFTGLLIGLWTYKCFMTIVFQEKFIYMPYMPPFARSEKVADYAEVCLPVLWVEKSIKSVDGTNLALLVGHIPDTGLDSEKSDIIEVILCYFQGNGSSLPPRLPLLSHVLRQLHGHRSGSPISSKIRYTIVALSYRGYWKSSGRASQKGIELDSQALLTWIEKSYSKVADAKKLHIMLWGQSIGAGIASTAAASHISTSRESRVPITALILETPFTSVKSLLIALYPQRWLPYQYLWPFLRNHWDSEKALRSISTCPKTPRILLLAATRDEVVPPEEVGKLEHLCTDLNIQLERKAVHGALHTEATTRREGQKAVADFIQSVMTVQS